MNQRILILSAIFTAVAVAGWPAASGGAATDVVVFPDLTPAQASTALSASQRLVWDRQTGIAVAEVPAAWMRKLTATRLEDLGPVMGTQDFDAALRLYLPGYLNAPREEAASAAPRYAVKAPAHLVKTASMVAELAKARASRNEDTTCLYEGFETDELPIWWEDGGNWWHYQYDNPNDTGDYFWLDDNCDAHSGQWEASATLGGTLGQYLSCNSNYASNTDSWMEYVPEITCASGVPEASLNFYLKVQSEPNYDLFYYLASVDGTNYYGYSLSGDWSDQWYLNDPYDLRNWTGLGDLTQYPYFYLAFAFQSDNQINEGFGARVDDISISATSFSVAAQADTQSGLVPLTVHFTATPLGGQAPYTYAWDFGDGSPRSFDQNPVHTYTATGRYPVQVTAQDSTGAVSTGGLTVTVSVPTPPVIQSMAKKGNPFRIVVLGADFMKSIQVYINGNQWPNVKVKSSGKLVIAGGAGLKAAVPKGVPTLFLFKNPDTTTATYTFSW
jgi:PKD repeat protein